MFFQIIRKELRSKKKINSQEGKGVVNVEYLDVPKVRSSKEFLKRLSVKREKGIEGTKNLVAIPGGQFKLTNFEVGCQNKKIVTSSVEQCIIEDLEGKNNEQCISKMTTLQVINESRARILAISKSLAYFCVKKQGKRRNKK